MSAGVDVVVVAIESVCAAQVCFVLFRSEKKTRTKRDEKKRNPSKFNETKRERRTYTVFWRVVVWRAENRKSKRVIVFFFFFLFSSCVTIFDLILKKFYFVVVTLRDRN